MHIYNIISGRRLFVVFVLFMLLPAVILAEYPDSAFQHIMSNLSVIKNMSAIMDVDYRTLCAVIYTERLLNYDWKDPALDALLAQSGWNSSIGFCQVKLKTAYWIEKQLSDSGSQFYPGTEFQNIISVSNSPNELINKLSNDSLNIHYAAAYLSIIQSYWQKAGFPINARPEIIGTLYSTGLFLRDGRVRVPKANPQANFFGLKVKESLHLFK